MKELFRFAVFFGDNDSDCCFESKSECFQNIVVMLSLFSLKGTFILYLKRDYDCYFKNKSQFKFPNTLPCPRQFRNLIKTKKKNKYQ